MNKVNVVKSVLWAFVAAGVVAALSRFGFGLGATTNLSDDTPWGLWIAFDVISGVALAAGGFVIAGTVYIFHLEKYRPILRPAVLTAFLGYVAVAIGLLFDLGLPWRIWHATIFWQHHSVLFEVAWCVMLYLTVLALEFAPVVLEHPLFQHPLFQAIHKGIKWMTLPLVIAGIVLSTLHQSSLGSLFLIMPYRLHPLWYSPLLPLLFFVSAIGLGLMMITLESFLSTWLFHHKPKKELLMGLGKAASRVLFLYCAIRMLDITLRGQLGYLFDDSWQSLLFTFEIMISAVIPAILLSFRSLRKRVDVLLACALMGVFGTVLYRFDVSLIAIQKLPKDVYFPSWIEIIVSLGLVSAAALVYIFFAENFRLFVDEPEEAITLKKPLFSPAEFDSASRVWLGDDTKKNVTIFSTIFIVVFALTVSLLPPSALSGYQAERVPVTKAVGWEMLKIDGNRALEFVLFDHKDHEKRLQEMYGEKQGCLHCHHAMLPKDGPDSCTLCHADMYQSTSIFNHDHHIQVLDGNRSCNQCHPAGQSKLTSTTVACTECHKQLFQNTDTTNGIPVSARSYFEAMHDLCIPCHTEQKKSVEKPNLDRCSTCHTNPPASIEPPLDLENVDLRPEALIQGKETEAS